MSDKAAQKRALIIEKARQVFAEKGYISVTMKDIVEACGISRGGLYLYFESTEEVFRAVLEAEKSRKRQKSELSLEDIGDQMDDPGDSSAAATLLAFFKEQKREILRRKSGLTIATYEYYLTMQLPPQEHPLRREFTEKTIYLINLIEAGNASGEFYCEYPKATARNILFALEGMKIAAHTMGVSEILLDRQLLQLLRGVLAEDSEEG